MILRSNSPIESIVSFSFRESDGRGEVTWGSTIHRQHSTKRFGENCSSRADETPRLITISRHHAQIKERSDNLRKVFLFGTGTSLFAILYCLLCNLTKAGKSIK